MKYLRTSDLARAVGVHPNTVRLYVDWGLLPPVERSPSGYRLFTRQHLDCLRLARLIYASEYPGRDLRTSSRDIIESARTGDWQGALDKARQHLLSVKAELGQADRAADLLEHWAQNMAEDSDEDPLAIGEVSKLLGVSLDVIRNWERNGLIRVRRNSYNGYRLFGKREIERLRMFIELDGGNTRDLKKALDTPRADEDIFTAADHWLTTLHAQEVCAGKAVELIEQVIAAGPRSLGVE